MQDEEQAASLYLRNIETGRLYGPFSGEETPPGGTELQVLLMPLAPEPVVDKDVPISRIIWKARCGEQPLAIEELRAIERELARSSYFLKCVYKAGTGSIIESEMDGTIHGWLVCCLNGEEAILSRSEITYSQKYVTLDMLQVHQVLTGLKMEKFELRNATVKEVVEELKKQVSGAFSEAGVLISVEGKDADWRKLPTINMSLRNLRVIDLLEYIREVYGIEFRIDANIIRLFPSEGLRDELK